MKNRFNTLIAICKKDFIGLAPLVLLVIGLIIMETLITKVEMDLQGQIWGLLKMSAPYVSSGAIGLLIIAAFQLDPPSSLDHDWLIRPIRKRDMFVAKVLFLLLATGLPLVLIRFGINILNGYSFTESVLEASTFKTPIAMIAIPVFIAIGIISKTVLQALGVVVGLLLFSAMSSIIPALFVPHPDKFNFNGFEWLPAWLVFIAVSVCMWLVAWFQYHRRDAFMARACVGITLLLGTFTLFASFQFPLWPPIYSILSSLVDEVEEDVITAITLDSVYGCYPAVKVGNDLYGDAETPQEGVKGLAGLNYFTAWELETAGPNGIAFSTRVQARNLPEDWRLSTINATATYSASEQSSRFSFAPARGAVPAIVNARSDGTHFWALPEREVKRFVDDPATKLTIDLDVALLAPIKHILEPNGQRRYLPGIGYCSAELDAIQNELQVECFKRGFRPTLVSAEIEGIPSSRVDAAKPNFSPKFLQFFGGAHYRMNIASASLLQNPKIVISVFELKAFTSKKLSTTGLLGASAEMCPPPSDDRQSESLLASWSDRSQHQASFINVDRNVRLEVLEWTFDGVEEQAGEERATLFLLAGGGATAHSFDDIAPRLAKHFRVIAVTRRGFGASSKPNTGYDMPRLSEDIIQVMNSLEIENAIFVGHSLAGDELSALGADFPGRVAGLVYLDAAYNRESLMAVNDGASLSGVEPPVPRPFPEELQSYKAVQGYFNRIGSVGSSEGAFMSSYDFVSGTRTTDQRIGQAIITQLEAPRYERITAPAVAIYALENAAHIMRPWYDPDDQLLRQQAEEAYRQRTKFQAEQISYFRNNMPKAEVIEIQGGDHAIYTSHPDEVVAAILNLAAPVPY